MDAMPEPIPRQVWAFWFGGPMQGARRASKNALEQTVGVPLVLVTDANLDKYVLQEHPLHPAFPNLTPVHKSVRAQAPGHRSMHSIGSNATPPPQDYLWAYFGHHYGGGFHDIKAPCGSWSPYFDRFSQRKAWSNASVWIFGLSEPGRGGVACRESAASDDPACLGLRATRGESATSFQSVLTEFPNAYIDGVIDDWDRTRGACCERIRDSYRKTLQVQQHIIRPRTALTSDWLRLAHASLDYKAARLARYPAPKGHFRCCFNHEGQYPMTWAELKGEITFPLHVKYAEYVRGGMPPKPGSGYRDSSEDGGGGVMLGGSSRSFSHTNRITGRASLGRSSLFR